GDTPPVAVVVTEPLVMTPVPDSFPLMVTAELNRTPALLLMAKFLSVVGNAVPLVWAAVPLNSQLAVESATMLPEVAMAVPVLICTHAPAGASLVVELASATKIPVPVMRLLVRINVPLLVKVEPVFTVTLLTPTRVIVLPPATP